MAGVKVAAPSHSPSLPAAGTTSYPSTHMCTIAQLCEAMLTGTPLYFYNAQGFMWPSSTMPGGR